MNLKTIIDFYTKNARYQAKHPHQEKLNQLTYFYAHEQITIDTITEYCIHRKIQGVKNSTINRELNLIRAAINYYSKHHDSHTTKNPFNGYKLFEKDYIPRYLTLKECKRLLQASLKNNHQQLHDFLVIALNTGCRASELLTLTWDNVYLQDNYFIIRNSLSKNKKTIYKPINTSTKQALERLKQHHKYVFYNPKTNTHIKTFRKSFIKALETAKLGKVRIHDLRHTFASLLIQQGTPIYHVSTLLGHSDTRITQRYAHLSPGYLQELISQLPKIG